MLGRILIGAHSIVAWPYLCIVVYDSDSGSAQLVMLLVQISITPLSPLKIERQEEEGM